MVSLARLSPSVMEAFLTALNGLLVLQPKVFKDDRGFFLESYNEKLLQALGIRQHLVQDNHS